MHVGQTKPVCLGAVSGNKDSIRASGATDPDCRVRVNFATPFLTFVMQRLSRLSPVLSCAGTATVSVQAQKKAEAEKRGVDVHNLLNEESSPSPAGSYGTICCFSDVMNYIHWTHASPTFTNLA